MTPSSVRASLFVSITLLCPQISSAAFLVSIDDFSAGPQNLDLSGTSSGSITDAASGPASAILGGEREAQFMVTSNPVLGTVIATIGAGVAAIDLDPLVTAGLELVYDGAGSGGLGGADLTLSGGGAIAIEVLSTDFSTTLSLDVVDLAGAAANSSHTTPGGILSPETFTFAFDDFTAVGGFDWTMIDSLRLSAVPSEGTDVVIGGIGTQALPVPEPSVTLLGLAALGSSLRRRRSPSVGVSAGRNT